MLMLNDDDDECMDEERKAIMSIKELPYITDATLSDHLKLICNVCGFSFRFRAMALTPIKY
jgi:hypothetical protein